MSISTSAPTFAENSQNMKIAIGGDHAGFQYKEKIKDLLTANGHDVEDFGPHSEDSCDYPDYVHPLATSVEEGKSDFGIAICGSGIGVSMVANKHQGVRAALCWLEELAQVTREHNDSNVLCIPARFVSEDLAMKMVDKFINTPFEGGRHQRRVDKIPC